jgi:hypothetical protein
MSTEQEAEIITERREDLFRHIRNVQDSCFLLADRLIKNGEERIGHELIANAFIHDNSKWRGIEWKWLHRDVVGTENEPFFMEALKHHWSMNPHHPEHYNNGIHEMPRVFIAEMVCDWSARSKEFCSDLREWIKKEAVPKYNMTFQSNAYKQIKDMTDILLDPQFKKMKG